MWFRVFGIRESTPEAADFLKHLHETGVPVPGHFGGDDQGWFRVDFVFDEAAPPLRLNRYLVVEEELRDILDGWAAWVEEQEDHPNVDRLMQHIVSTQQVFTLECSRDRYEEDRVRSLCLGACQYLARETGGIYQVDNEGFYAANGKLLLPEEPADEVA
jgi:hypothetical protein